MARRESQAVNIAYGIGAIGVLCAVVALSMALYGHRFTDTSPLTINSSRAGLMMSKGGAVKLRGVQVGTVSKVRSTTDGAAIDLKIESRYMDAIPSDIRARIVPTTVFGNKYVELVASGRTSTPARAGAVVAADHVTVEINDTFASLMSLLDSVKPRQVNAALTSLAEALRGNGATAGEFISLLNTYLGEINPSLPTFNSDITNGATVTGHYAELAPDLVDVAANSTTISDSVVANKASLDALLISFTRLADKTGDLITRNEAGLATALRRLDPSTALLAKYSPEFPCLIQGLAIDNGLATKALGIAQQGINSVVGLLPAQSPYKHSADLPEVRAAAAPACYGLPNLTPGVLPPHPAFDTGGQDPYLGDKVQGGIGGTAGGVGSVYVKQFFDSVLGLGGLL